MKQTVFQKTARIASVIFCIGLCCANYLPPMRALRALPETIRISGSTEPSANIEVERRLAGWLTGEQETVAVAASSDERLQDAQRSTVTYRLFGVLPLKTVAVVRSEDVFLVPGGAAVGITIRTQGVLVVGLGAVDTDEGVLSPGNAAGILAGDVIVSADGEDVKNADHLARLTRASDGVMELTLLRGEETVAASIQLVRDAADGLFRIGLWVRDSTAGVGTISFYDPSLGWFAALGHPVSDVDTQSLLSVREGRIVSTQIVDVRKGEKGVPGELIGEFSVSGQQLGKIGLNSEFGIFGRMEQPYANPIYEQLPMGYGFEAHTGAAQILATVSSDGVQAFDCEIIRVNPQSQAAVKGMVIDITDARLLNSTGGIVQGMSGCPVVQDGKLVGVVTHVFVNDPTRGYCVYAEWMRDRIVEAASAGRE